VQAATAGQPGAVRQFTAVEVLARIEEYGDLMADLLAGGPAVPA
jgi:bifunctional non-homologous end joining protein LigD